MSLSIPILVPTTAFAWWTKMAVVLGTVVFGWLPARAEKEPGEYEVKAAFLYNFIAFAEWPESAFANAESPIVIGILGRDPFGSALDTIMNGERVQERSLRVLHLVRPEDMNRCHIIFISTSESARLGEIMRQLGTKPVLTVSDIPGFAEAGGMVGFTTADTVKLTINQDALRTARLALSAKLLRLARVVERPPSS